MRETIRNIGYTSSDYGFDADSCGVIVSIKEQSADIALGVDNALENKNGEMSDEQIESIGAGDQGMMIGFACNETPDLMPLSIALAHQITRQVGPGPQEWRTKLPAAGRQEPGDGRIRLWQAETG